MQVLSEAIAEFRRRARQFEFAYTSEGGEGPSQDASIARYLTEALEVMAWHLITLTATGQSSTSNLGLFYRERELTLFSGVGYLPDDLGILIGFKQSRSDVQHLPASAIGSYSGGSFTPGGWSQVGFTGNATGTRWVLYNSNLRDSLFQGPIASASTDASGKATITMDVDANLLYGIKLRVENDWYNGLSLRFTTSTNQQDKVYYITDFDGASRVLTLHRGWDGTAPTTGDVVGTRCELRGSALQLWLYDAMMRYPNVSENRWGPLYARLEKRTDEECHYAHAYQLGG